MIETQNHQNSPETRCDIEPTLIFVCGVSAVGKTTLSSMCCETLNSLGIAARRPVAYTTREPREGEVNGIDYEFIPKNDFDNIYLPEICANPEDWDVGNINGNWYFNKLSDTVPNAQFPVSILPVSIDVCDEMICKYAKDFPNLKIKVLFIKLNKTNKEVWEERMMSCRKSRIPNMELSLNSIYSFPLSKPYEIIYPEWNLDADKIKFIESVLTAIYCK